jgi:hypothetical protein
VLTSPGGIVSVGSGSMGVVDLLISDLDISEVGVGALGLCYTNSPDIVKCEVVT